MTAVEAQKIRVALANLGLRERFDFKVKGEGFAILYTNRALDIAYDHAAELVGQGLTIDRWTVRGRKCVHINMRHQPARLLDRGEIATMERR